MGVRLARAYDSVTTTCMKSIYQLHYKVTLPARTILAANVFGTGIFP